MLSGIILLVTVIILAWFWHLESGEQRKKNKELLRITQRLEKQSLDSFKEKESFDVTILWGDIVTIIDSLQSANKYPEDVQGIKDLALLIDNKNLIIKKQGKYIRINDIAHLQEFVDTHDPKIKCHEYLTSSSSSFSLKESDNKQESSDVHLDSKKGAFLALAKVVSNKNDHVHDEITMYFDSPEKYFDKFYFDLTQRGIDKLADVQDVVVLVDALARQKKLVYQDWKTEIYQTLELLDLIVEGELIKAIRFADLVEQAKISLINLSVLEEQQGDAVFELINACGYKLLSIDENADSYALILIPINVLNQFIELSGLVDIRLKFIDKQ